MRRGWVIVIVGAMLAGAAGLAVAPAAPDASVRVAQRLTRAQIRSMPILERPDRPAHIYGNAVRRRNQRAVTPTPVRPAPPR